MQGIKKLLVIAFMAVTLTACDDDDDNNNVVTPPPEPPPPPAVTNIRVVHASADAPTVDILANGNVLAGLENVDYQVSSPWIEVEVGTYDIAVEANLPGDDANVIEATLTFGEGSTYEIIALGSVAAETLDALVIENTAAAVTAGNVRVQVVHAAANAPTVDIYVTAPGDALDAAQPLATAAFMDFTGQVEVPAGDYQIRITPMGTLDVVFDSGSIDLADGADLLVMATDNVGTGDSPVTLLVADGTTSFKIWDANAGTELRVAHAVADAPAVDVIANNELTLVDALAFPSATDYLSVAAADYLIDVAVDADNSVVVIDDAAVTLAPGTRYTAIANNEVSNIDLDLLIDDIRSVATAAKVRIIHASPSAGEVDIYVTTDGMIDDVDPAFTAVPYSEDMLAETGYVELAEGSYVISATPTGSKDVVLETDVLALATGEVYTAIVVDQTGGGLPPQIIGLDGLAAAPEPLAEPSVRVVHASADAPTVDILANGSVLAGLENVDYQVASGWITVEDGTYDIAVEANLPGDDANVIEATLTFAEGNTYDILAVGSVAAATLEPLVIENTASDVTDGNVRVQVVHAAAGAPTVDIFVTAPDDMLSMASPLATASYKDFTMQVEVPAGDYQIRITPTGTLDVVYDSGTVALEDGADLLVMATDNVDTGVSPVSLLVADGMTSFEIWDAMAGAELRVAHAVADAPAVDVIANNELTLVDALAFPTATDYLSVANGDYLIDVAADADNSVVVIDDAAVTLTNGVRYTAIANNDLENIDLDLLVDDIRSVATAAKVRIIHASPSAGEVDIYVTADGMIDNVDPAFTAVPYSEGMLAETGYVELAEGTYVVSATPTGTKTVVLDTGELALSAGGVYTAIVVDATGGGLPPQIIGLDGLAPE